MTPLADHSDAHQRVQTLRDAMPEGGMFRDKDWLLSPKAFPLQRDQVEKLQRLGPALRSFQVACNRLYLESTAGGPHDWVAKLLDQGKPASTIALGRLPRWHEQLPSVIRPDLVFTEAGFSIAELDSLPGGIGLTGWLGETFAALGENILGGANGMVEGFSKAFPGHDLLISRESGDYQPEMEWLLDKLNTLEGGSRRLLNPWSIEPYELAGCSVYRFFELWDLANVENAPALLSMAQSGELDFTPPLKAYLEEKLWLGLFWSPALRAWWENALSPETMTLLRECIPQGWVLDPVTLPYEAEWPGLGIQSWQEMKKFGNKERELVIKISGFAETAWGSRGVSIGHDLSQEEWSRTIDEALQSYGQNPHVMQRFHKGRVVTHLVWDDATQEVKMMQGRVRLCPYYFVAGEETSLGGVLATVVPADKKILHGMRDAIMLPCAVKA
jgi:hypothetical protein